MAPEISCVKTVILCTAERVFRSWISEGTNQPMGPHAKPNAIEYSAICTANHLLKVLLDNLKRQV